MDVRVVRVVVPSQKVVMLSAERVARPGARRGLDAITRRSGRHREDDPDALRRVRRCLALRLSRIREKPIVMQGTQPGAVSDALAILRFGLESPVAGDVVHVGFEVPNATARAPRHLDHALRDLRYDPAKPGLTGSGKGAATATPF